MAGARVLPNEHYPRNRVYCRAPKVLNGLGRVGHKLVLYWSPAIIEHVGQRGMEKIETTDVLPWPEPELACVRGIFSPLAK